MKILIVSYYAWTFGGAETYLFQITEELQKQGHDVRIFASEQGRHEHNLMADYTFPAASTKLGWALRSLFNPRSLVEFRKTLKEFQPDIVHINSVSNETSPSITLALRKYPTVLWVHSRYMFEVDKTLHGFKKIFAKVTVFTKKHMMYNVDGYITSGTSLCKTIPASKKPVKICPYGIVPLPYTEIKNFNNLLYVGRLAKDKGVKVLLDALPEVVKALPEIKLQLIGAGPELETLQNTAKAYGLKKQVKFLGYMDRQEVAYYLQCSTLLVIPSIYEEPFGIVGIEALFSGRPVIGSNIGGIPEWLHKRCGILFKAGDSKELSNAILTLLSDKKRLISLSENAHQEAQKYTIQNHSLKIIGIYKSIAHTK